MYGVYSSTVTWRYPVVGLCTHPDNVPTSLDIYPVNSGPEAEQLTSKAKNILFYFLSILVGLVFHRLLSLRIPHRYNVKVYSVYRGSEYSIYGAKVSTVQSGSKKRFFLNMTSRCFDIQFWFFNWIFFRIKRRLSLSSLFMVKKHHEPKLKNWFGDSVALDVHNVGTQM
jgi:hypothetical protein